MRILSGIRRLAGALVLVAACRSVETPFEYPDDLDHPNYVKRAKAVRQFAVLQDEEQIPRAFRLLRDDDASIRGMAWQTLKEMMPEGRDFGYRPYLPEAVRNGVAKRWEAWWRKTQAETARG